MAARIAVTLVLLLALVPLWLLQSTSPAKDWPMLGWPNPDRYLADMQMSGSAGPQATQNLVHVTPLKANTMAILALSATQKKDDKLAASALTVAGSMGWHHSGVQAFWLQAALAAQDWKIAAQRLDALLRIDAPEVLWSDHMATLLAVPDGLKAMAVQAAKNPEWTSKALVSIDPARADRQTVANRLTLVETAWPQGLRIDCPALALLTNATVDTGLAVRGNDLWSRHCDPGSIEHDGVLNLSTSDSAEQTRSLFGWTAVSSGRFSVNLTTDDQHGAAIHVNSSSMTSEAVARRVLTLRPGKYRLSWKVESTEDPASHGISFLVRCNVPGTSQYNQVPFEMNDAGNALTFTIAQQDCPMQDIRIVISSSNKPFSSMAAAITDIRLKSA